MNRGSVVWLNIPPPDPTNPSTVQAGRRPAIIVQADTAVIATRGGALLTSTVTVIPLTSKLTARRFPGAVEIAATRGNGLTQTSIALVHQTTTVDRRLVASIAGALDDQDRRQLDSALRRYLGLE